MNYDAVNVFNGRIARIRLEVGGLNPGQFRADHACLPLEDHYHNLYHLEEQKYLQISDMPQLPFQERCCRKKRKVFFIENCLLTDFFSRYKGFNRNEIYRRLNKIKLSWQQLRHLFYFLQIFIKRRKERLQQETGFFCSIQIFGTDFC